MNLKAFTVSEASWVQTPKAPCSHSCVDVNEMLSGEPERLGGQVPEFCGTVQ